VIVSRLLGPARYGALGAVLALTSLAGNATGAVSTAVTRTVAVRRGGAEWDVARARRRGFIAALAALVIVAALAAPLESYLHLGSPVPVLLLAVMAAAILAGLVPRGVLMGERRFAPVATALATGVTLKLVAGALLASSLGVSGAVAAAALGEAITTLLYIRALGRRHGSTELRVPLRSSSLATGAYGGFWLLAAADTFFARHLLTATGSGLYVAASTAGSIALFLPNNITLTAFPSLAGAAGDGNSPPGMFSRAFIAASDGVDHLTRRAARPALAVELGPDIVDHHPCSLTGELEGVGPADPTPGAGHDDHPPVADAAHPTDPLLVPLAPTQPRATSTRSRTRLLPGHEPGFYSVTNPAGRGSSGSGPGSAGRRAATIRSDAAPIASIRTRLTDMASKAIWRGEWCAALTTMASPPRPTQGSRQVRRWWAN